MDVINKRIEEAREKSNIMQSQSASNKKCLGFHSFRLTLEQEIVIKGNLSEMYVLCVHI